MRRTAVLLVPALLLSCSHDFIEPPDAFITCEEGGDACPEGYTCSAEIGRCVREKDRDVTAPTLDSHTVTGSPARLGGTLLVTLTVNEELAASSKVYLDLGGAPTDATTFDRTGQSGLTYSFAFPVSEERNEGTQGLTALLADEWGNDNTVPLDQVVLDFTAPRITGLARSSDDPLTRGSEAAVTFTASEELDGEPVVTLGGRAMVHDGTVAAPDFRYTHTLDDQDTQGPVDLSISVADPAGNPGSHQEPAYFSYDFDPPSVVSAAVEPPVARASRVIQVQVRFDQDVQQDPPPVLTANPALDFTWHGASEQVHTFQHAVVDGDADGPYELFVMARDLAGNTPTSPLAVGAAARIDTTPPTLGAVELTPLDGSRVNHGTPVSFSFSVVEAEGIDEEYPRVLLGDRPMDPQEDPEEGFAYTYTHTVSDTDDEPGLNGIAVELLDTAGNQAVLAAGSLFFDFQTPTVLSATPNPTAAKSGDVVYYDVTPSEPLSGPPKLTVTGAARGQMPGTFFTLVQGTAYKFRHAVADSEDDSYTVVVDQTDVAGNPGEPYTGDPFSIDSSVPEISDLELKDGVERYSDEAGHELVEVRFNVSENVDGAELTATLGGSDMSCGAYQTAQPNYTCTYTVTGGDTSGFKTVWIRAADAAGNADSDSIGLVLDLEPPEVLATDAQPSLAGLNSTVVYSLTADEPLDAGSPPVLTTANLGGWNGPTVSGTTAAWTRAVTDAPTDDGSHEIAITSICDDVANCTSISGLAEGAVDVVIDNELPGLDGAPVIAIDTGYERARHDATVSVDFSVDDALSTPPTATLGGEAMACDGIHPDYGCTLLIDENRDSEGVAAVLVTLVDMAYNQSSPQAGSVTLDFTPPDLVPGSVSRLLQPHDSNLLREVETVRGDTTVRLTFTLTEPLDNASGGAQPIPRVVSKQGGVVGSQSSQAGTQFTYEILPGVNPGDYDEDLVISDAPAIEDLAGNRPEGTIFLATERVDTVAPSLPRVDTEDRIVYYRLPWGIDRTSGSAAFMVEGLNNAVEPGSWVIARDSADPTGAAELGRFEADGNGRFGTSDPSDNAEHLVRSDRPEIYLISVDLAGNEATPVKVRDVTWTATMIGKVPGSTFENPHRLVLAERLHPTLQPTAESSRETSDDELTGVSERGDDLSAGYTGSPYWRSRGGDENWLKGIYSLDAAYDLGRGEAVLFLWDYGRTWLWNSRAEVWQEANRFGISPPYGGGPMTYHGARNRVVLYTGDGETWEWSGDTGIWHEIETPGATPDARSYHAIFYDSHRGTLVLHGGYAGSGQYLNDTWELSRSNTWKKLEPSTSPPGRANHAIAYDRDNGQAVLFGGNDGDGRRNDTWIWNSERGSWREVTDLIPKPPVRSLHTMTYDPMGRRVVLFGGKDGSTSRDDTWHFDTDSMTWDSTGGPPPQSTYRDKHVMVHDPIRERTVMFGVKPVSGDDPNEPEVWVMTPKTGVWSRHLHAPVPARYLHGLAFDNSRARMVTTAGIDSDHHRVNDTWEWDARTGTWSEITPSTTVPGERSHFGMAYDVNRNVTVMHSGYVGGGLEMSTWEWDGIDWSETTGTNNRGSPTLVYHPVRKKVQWIAGSAWPEGAMTFGDAWEWDGVAGQWDLLLMSFMQPEWRRPGLVYDTQRNLLVAFSGDDNGDPPNPIDETWEWNGDPATTWQKVTITGTSPGGRVHPAMVYDTTCQYTVMFGGDGARDTWRYKPLDATWEQLDLQVRPPGYWYPEMVWSGSRGLLFGGDVTNKTLWEWNGGRYDRPAALWTVSWAATGADAVTFRDLTAELSVGGLGHNSSGTAIEGTDLLAWSSRTLDWVTLQSNTDRPDRPGRLNARVADTEVEPLLVGDPETFTFAVAPTAYNGAGFVPGEVAVDYLEMTVRYRLNP